MRAEEQLRSRGLSGWIRCAQIPGGIYANYNAERFQPARDFAVAVAHRRRKKCPPRADLIFRKSRQPLASGNHFFGTLAHFCGRHLATLEIRALTPRG